MISLLEYVFIAIFVGIPWSVGCMYIGYKLPSALATVKKYLTP